VPVMAPRRRIRRVRNVKNPRRRAAAQREFHIFLAVVRRGKTPAVRLQAPPAAKLVKSNWPFEPVWKWTWP
jgi:hypothetical protein